MAEVKTLRGQDPVGRAKRWPREFRRQMNPFVKPEVWGFREKAIAIRKGEGFST
jgi:hypothetical protein